MTSLWGLVHYPDSFLISYSLENKNKKKKILIPLNNHNKTFGDRGLVRAHIVLIIQKFQNF